MIQIRGLHVRYQSERGEMHAVRGIDLEVKEGEFYTLLGPSGCGKTTTLRCLAGLEVASVVVSPWPGEPSAMELSNLETIRQIGAAAVETLPRLDLSSPKVSPKARAP